MASRDQFSKTLRVVGQVLEERRIDLFDLKCFGDEFHLQCGDPMPPHLNLVEVRYSAAEIDALDRAARRNRQGSVQFVNFDGLPEILRAPDTGLTFPMADCCVSTILIRPSLSTPSRSNIKPTMENFTPQSFLAVTYVNKRSSCTNTIHDAATAPFGNEQNNWAIASNRHGWRTDSPQAYRPSLIAMSTLRAHSNVGAHLFTPGISTG